MYENGAFILRAIMMVHCGCARCSCVDVRAMFEAATSVGVSLISLIALVGEV
jgi:hypothetical protein